MPRNIGAKSRVIAYLLEQPNVEVHTQQIVKATGLDARQVSNAVHAAKSQINIVNLGRNLFRYVPGAKADAPSVLPPATPKRGALYVLVGVSSAGDHVIEDESGKLYRAVPL